MYLTIKGEKMGHFDQCQFCKKQGAISSCISCLHNDRKVADKLSNVVGFRLPSGAEIAERARNREENNDL